MKDMFLALMLILNNLKVVTIWKVPEDVLTANFQTS